MGKKKFVSNQCRREQRHKSNLVNFVPVYSSRDSVSSDERNVSATKQNGNYVRRSRRKRRASVQTGSKNKNRSSSRVKQRTLSKSFTPSESVLNSGNPPPTQLYISTLEQNVHDICRFAGQPNGRFEGFSNTCGYNSPLFFPNFEQNVHPFTGQPYRRFEGFSNTYGYDPSTPLFSPTLEQNVRNVYPIKGQPDSYFEDFPDLRLFSISPIFSLESFGYHGNFKRPLQTSVTPYDSAYHCSKSKIFRDCFFQSEKSTPCSSINSNLTASSGVHKLISNCIRNSDMPSNINKPLASSTAFSSQRSYSHHSNFYTSQSSPIDYPDVLERGRIESISQNINKHLVYPSINSIKTANQMTNLQFSTTSHSILKDPPSLEKRIFSPCSTTVEVGGMETIQEKRTSSFSSTEPPSSTESSPELIYYPPLNSPTSDKFETSSKESWASDDSTESINQPVESFLGAYTLPFKGNYTYPRTVSDVNGENDIALKNENSSKTFIFPEKRKNPSQIQIDASLPSTSIPLCESKLIKNPGSTNPTPSYSAILDHPRIRSSNYSKATNEFQNYIPQSNISLASNDSGIRSSLCLKESISQHVTTLSLAELPLKSEEKYRTETTVDNVSQSFTAMSITCGRSTADASEIKSSNESNLELSAHSKNKTKLKKSKFISCLKSILCLRPASSRHDGQN